MRADQAGLRAAGIIRLSLSGSAARGDADAGVKLAAGFDPEAHMNLLSLAALQSMVGRYPWYG